MICRSTIILLEGRLGDFVVIHLAFQCWCRTRKGTAAHIGRSTESWSGGMAGLSQAQTALRQSLQRIEYARSALEDYRNELASKSFRGSAIGGEVKVTVSGALFLLELEISPSAAERDDLTECVLAAFQKASLAATREHYATASFVIENVARMNNGDDFSAAKF